MALIAGLKNLLKNNNNHQQQATTTDSNTSTAAGTSSTVPSRRSRDQQLPQQAAAASSSAPTTSTQPHNTTAASTTTAPATMNPAPSSSKQDQAEQIVKRENELKHKREQQQYEGLPDGVTLGIKMGDGAFSNVFQATLRPNAAQLAIDPTLGKQVKVAVKCVRKYELNHSQVSRTLVPILYGVPPRPKLRQHSPRRVTQFPSASVVIAPRAFSKESDRPRVAIDYMRAWHDSALGLYRYISQGVFKLCSNAEACVRRRSKGGRSLRSTAGGCTLSTFLPHFPTAPLSITRQ